ncbi:MAG: hypothetical protein AAGF24_08585 [Cyanobacteria bacterium P01_H01_bin.121]
MRTDKQTQRFVEQFWAVFGTRSSQPSNSIEELEAQIQLTIQVYFGQRGSGRLGLA